MRCSTSSTKRVVYSSTIPPQETHRVDNLLLHLKQLEKEEQKYPKINRRKEIIKIWAEINEKEIIETIVKFNKTKKMFLWEDKQNWQTFSQTYQGKKERRIKSTKLEMKKKRLQAMQKYKGL